MRNASSDRRSPASTSCAVCGEVDARVLSFTRLQDGERVTVCGSHKTAHHRSGVIASSVDELKKLTADRRAS
ncbi:MAG: hypothetical protein KIT84_12740 [Labilithrix sp.]|nr:hypothetical protein [Labilithrix sp.]MCW5811882.1 hypothetical protein [Labilithrix sp.]